LSAGVAGSDAQHGERRDDVIGERCVEMNVPRCVLEEPSGRWRRSTLGQMV
jgi:hypothetical protein